MARQPQIRVSIGGKDVTQYVEDGASWSNVDPGGCEAAQIALPREGSIKRGQRVLISVGLETVFDGRVQRVGRKLSGGSGVNVSCEGAGAAMKDALVQAVWIDRDMTRVGEPAAGRIQPLTPAGYRGFGGNVLSAGEHAQLETEIIGSWAVKPHCCPALVSPVPIKKIYYIQYTTSSVSAADPNWHWNINTWQYPDYLGVLSNQPDLKGTAAAGWWAPSVPSRLLEFLHYYAAAPAGAVGEKYAVYWSIVMFGEHDLPLRGTEPAYGFYASDIFRDLLTYVPDVAEGVIEEANGFTIPHFVAYTSVEVESVALQLALLAGGWHYGTWPAATVFDDKPVADFRAHAKTATCHVTRADCDELDLEDDLSRLYNVAEVSFTDGNESAGKVTVTRDVPELSDANLTRELPVSLGEGTEAAAEAYGYFMLALAERAARASGSATMTQPVRLPRGGRKPAYLLRSGIDRLKVTDIESPSLVEPSRGEFQIKRVEASAGPEGITTRLELGLGADLVEVLNARLQLKTDVALFGR